MMQEIYVGVDVARDFRPSASNTTSATTWPRSKTGRWYRADRRHCQSCQLREACLPGAAASRRVHISPPRSQSRRGLTRADIHSASARKPFRPTKLRLASLIAADPELAALDRRLRTVPGAGPVVAAILISELPESGRLDRRRIAALAGLAPITRDRAERAGRRPIGGGRPVARTMLYIAALHASRHSAVFRTFRNRLEADGKATKVAITATARKPLGALNSMLATATDYRHDAPA